jgi:hypothetical protein
MVDSILSSLGLLFPGLPRPLIEELVNEYFKINKNFRENRWEPSELNGGKFCEVVYTILQGFIDKSYPTNASKPSNMLDACRNLEKIPDLSIPRSIRIQIPRILIALYEVRNNRGVGHVGGDVDPNHMDALYVVYSAKWVLAELIRIYHNLDLESAEKVVDSIVERIVPSVWEINGKKRVLDSSLTMKNKTLLVLYSSVNPIKEQDLQLWVEHSNPSVYRQDVIRKMHLEKLIEYDPILKICTLSPKGIDYVEKTLL